MKKVKLIYWNSDNFGDVLGPFIIHHLSDVRIKMKYSSITIIEFFRILLKGLLNMRLKGMLDELYHRSYFFEKTYLTVGSIAAWGNRKSVIWGSGFMNENENFNGGQVLALRGKLSAEKIKNQIPYQITVFGDPALLLSILYNNPQTQKHFVGIIPHWKDIDSIKSTCPEQFIIDLRTKEISSVIDKIRSCKYILSSSLHGIIVAHCYNIPAIWIKEGYIDTDGFKFRDYFSSVGIRNYLPYENYKEIVSDESSVEELFSLNKEISLPQINIKIIQKSLLQSYPLPLMDKWKNIFV